MLIKEYRKNAAEHARAAALATEGSEKQPENCTAFPAGPVRGLTKEEVDDVSNFWWNFLRPHKHPRVPKVEK